MTLFYNLILLYIHNYCFIITTGQIILNLLYFNGFVNYINFVKGDRNSIGRNLDVAIFMIILFVQCEVESDSTERLKNVFFFELLF